MNAVVFYAFILLTGTWIILSESISITTIISGAVISILCLFISVRMLPVQKIKNVKLLRFSIYLFYLIGQIYFSAFKVIKLIFTGAVVNVVDVKIKITNKFLQTILANSITLPPGTISLNLNNDTITVLQLNKKKYDPSDEEAESSAIKGKFEKMLLKMQK